MNDKKDSWFRGEIQFIAWIIAVTAAVLVPIITSQNDIKRCSDSLSEIKTARAEAWNNQREINNNIVENLQDIGECLAVVKDKLQIK
jgi:hypothetical protein